MSKRAGLKVILIEIDFRERESRMDQTLQFGKKSYVYWILLVMLSSCQFGPQRSDGLFFNAGTNNNAGNNNGENNNGNNNGENNKDPRANNPPPLEHEFEGWGYEATQTFKVRAKNHLEIQIQPHSQNKPIRGTAVYFNYSQLAVHIEINNDTKTLQATPLLGNDLASTPAEKSNVFDYSQYAKSKCTSASELCEFTITIKRPNYDGWCFARGYCPSIYPTHTRVRTTLDQKQQVIGDQWRGIVFIGTDETKELK